jgi:putative DNA primase/helicase
VITDYDDEEVITDQELADAQSPRTDAANADEVVKAYPNTFLYVAEWETWIVWDTTRWLLPGGKSGARDSVLQSIVRTARVRYLAAKTRHAQLVEEEKEIITKHSKDSDEWEANERARKAEAKLLVWLEASQNSSRVNGCEALLRGRLVVRQADLDARPWLLNVSNGTIDLRTGELHYHDRTDLLTQLTPIEYDAAARAPTWHAFLDRAMAGSTIMALYLQRVIGYTLTGTTQEHVLVFHYGHTGSNGKSTFLDTIRTLMGEYGCTAPRSLLFEPRNGAEPHPTELARLYGKRLATCSEVPENVELAEAKVKDLTGGDILSVRRMNENFWDLVPTHTLHAAGNHKPTVRGTDGGIWRRIKLVPWLVKIPDEEQDKGLKAKLRAELPGILAWAVHGCLEWQRVGLAEPAEVTAAGDEYRSESDVLGAFFATQCVFAPGERFACKYLRKAYETWCEEMGYRSVGARILGRRLREKGVKETSVRADGKVVQGWSGVRLRDHQEHGTASLPLESGHAHAN